MTRILVISNVIFIICLQMYSKEASEEQKSEIPPPQTFLVHRRPPAARTISQPATSLYHTTRNNAATTTAAPQPKKATHFTIRTLFDDSPLAPDLASIEVVDEEDHMVGTLVSGFAPLTATPSSMQLLAGIGGKKGKGKGKGEILLPAEGEVINAAYALLPPGTPPSQNGKRKITKKGYNKIMILKIKNSHTYTDLKPKKKDNPELPPQVLNRTRWLIPPKSTRQITVCFNGEAGSYDEVLTFGITGIQILPYLIYFNNFV
jgi:hypothetical protein